MGCEVHPFLRLPASASVCTPPWPLAALTPVPEVSPQPSLPADLTQPSLSLPHYGQGKTEPTVLIAILPASDLGGREGGPGLS